MLAAGFLSGARGPPSEGSAMCRAARPRGGVSVPFLRMASSSGWEGLYFDLHKIKNLGRWQLLKVLSAGLCSFL